LQRKASFGGYGEQGTYYECRRHAWSSWLQVVCPSLARAAPSALWSLRAVLCSSNERACSHVQASATATNSLLVSSFATLRCCLLNWRLNIQKRHGHILLFHVERGVVQEAPLMRECVKDESVCPHI
jgi:hypothetical protein